MKAVVVYESMYGNTHIVANAIGEGLGNAVDVSVVPVDLATRELLASADLVVVGGPTHVHGMSRESTRHAALEAAEKPGKELELDPDAEGEGLREWFDGLDALDARAAAFDTRMPGPAVLTGRASKGIVRKLRHLGAPVVAEPTSFLVTKESHLAADQEQAAREWGRELARLASSSAAAGLDA